MHLILIQITFAIVSWGALQSISAQEFELPPDKITEALVKRADLIAKLVSSKQLTPQNVSGVTQQIRGNKTSNVTGNKQNNAGDKKNSADLVNPGCDTLDADDCEECECDYCDECSDVDPVTETIPRYQVSTDGPKLSQADRCVVFSWQVLTQYSNEVWIDSAPSKVVHHISNCFDNDSVRAAEPTLPIFLFTNIPAEKIDDDIRENITVVEVDLMAEAGLYPLLERTKDSKVGFGTKPQALITGWEKDILPSYVLYLDVDIIVAKGTADFNLDAIFQPLKFYDISACYEGYALGPRPTPAVGAGWEINTGVMGLRKSSLGLLHNWLQEFKGRQDVYTKFISGEQQALMVALERSSAYRVYPLPAVFNFRRPTVLSMAGPEQATIVQSHIYSDLRLKVSNFLQVAHEAAIVMMEDCLHHMKKVGLPTHFLCGALVG